MIFENKPQIGIGIYTASEIANILRVPKQKVHRWIDVYWDGKLADNHSGNYSWKTGNSKAVGFLTLIEFYVMMELSERGVKPAKVIKAHKKLSEIHQNNFPFALKAVLEGLKTDGSHVYYKDAGQILSLDGSDQLNLDFIRLFFKNLEFDSDNIASRFWPLGKKNSIILDPERKFGHPLINDHNIYPETIYQHYKAGDPVEYLADIYSLSVKQINDALEFCEAA
jgi:uncharacterized protein (DUF433 family)